MSRNNRSPDVPMTVRRSLVASFAQRYTNFLLTFPIIILVSRWLSPEEIGVYSIASAFLLLVHALRDFGVSDYLVQKKVLDDTSAGSAFAVTCVTAWSMALMVLLGSEPLARFYGDPALASVLQILSINFFLLPIGSTATAMLKRSMQFGIIYRINLIQQSAASSSTLFLTYIGFSYYGLAIGSVVGTVGTIVGCFTFGRYYRIRGFNFVHWREVSNFGIHRVSADVLTRVSAAAPEFIIGRIVGLSAVAYYSRGQGLVKMFRENVLDAIGTVTFSSYSQMNRNGEKPHELLVKSLFFITAVSWPFLCFAILFAYPIMHIVFGDQWDDAVPLLRIFCMSAIIGVANGECSRLFIAIGRVSLVTRLSFASLCFRLALLVPAAYISLAAVVWVQVFTAISLGVTYYYLMTKHTEVRLVELLKPLGRSFLVTVLSMLPAVLVFCFLPPSSDDLFLPVMTAGIGTLISWLFALRMFQHPMWFEFMQWVDDFRAHYGVRRI